VKSELTTVCAFSILERNDGTSNGEDGGRGEDKGDEDSAAASATSKQRGRLSLNGKTD